MVYGYQYKFVFPVGTPEFFIRSEVIFLKIPISTPSVFELEYYVNYCIL